MEVILIVIFLSKIETTQLESRTDLFQLTKELFSVGLKPSDYNVNPYLYTSWLDILKHRSEKRSNTAQYKFPSNCYGYNLCSNKKTSSTRPVANIQVIDSTKLKKEWSGITILSNILIVGSAVIFSGKIKSLLQSLCRQNFVMSVACKVKKKKL